MNRSHLNPFILVVALSGCGGISSELFAMHGPIAATHPGMIIPYASKYTNYEGSILFTRPDGVICTGNWSRPSPRTRRSAALPLSSIASGSGELPEDGGTHVDSSGTGYVDHGDRSATGTGDGECDNGTTFKFWFVADGVHAEGELKDTEGNTFLLARAAKAVTRAEIQALAREINSTDETKN